MHYGDLSTSTRLRVVPIFPQVSRASETRARVKITPREKRRVMPFLAWGDFHPPSRPRTELLDNSPHDSLRTAVQPFMRHLQSRICLVPRPHYYARPMRFGSRGPRKFLRPRQTRRSETFCLTWGGAFGSGRAVNNFSALMKDVQQPWRVQRIKS